MSIVYIVIFGVLLIAVLSAGKIGNKKVARAVSITAFLGICVCCFFYFRTAGSGAESPQLTAQSFYSSQGYVIGELLKESKVRRIALLAEAEMDEEPLRQLADALRTASGAEAEIVKLPASEGPADIAMQVRPNELDKAIGEQFDAVVFTFNCPVESYRASMLARRVRRKTLQSVLLNYFDTAAARKMIEEGSLTMATARKATASDAKPAKTPRETFDVAYQLIK